MSMTAVFTRGSLRARALDVRGHCEDRSMVYITHVRFAGDGSSPEDIIMLRWREAMGDTNVADMIEWIESGGIAKVADGSHEYELTVVREAGRKPYLQTVAAGRPSNKIVELPRF
jgi:hypothetical protein